eukprot:s1917_g24.t1
MLLNVLGTIGSDACHCSQKRLHTSSPSAPGTTVEDLQAYRPQEALCPKPTHLQTRISSTLMSCTKLAEQEERSSPKAQHQTAPVVGCG